MTHHNFAWACNLAENMLRLYPFMATKRIQDSISRKTGCDLDGRTIAGMRATLHRNMVKPTRLAA